MTFSMRPALAAVLVFILAAYAGAAVRLPAPGTMTPALHAKFMENGAYALADGLLNASWKMAKGRIPAAEWRELLDSQREWLKSGRDDGAAAHMGSMPPVEAYALATRERADDIAELFASRPEAGKYSGREAWFEVSREKGKIAIAGEAGKGACAFSGQGAPQRGWMHMERPGHAGFYILFSADGAVIYCQEKAQCPGMGGEYRRR